MNMRFVEGLVIEARTGVPKWFGERTDYNEAIGALQDRAAKAKWSANLLEPRAPRRLRLTHADIGI
jgi:hypothetical protein